jgi:hypothetical protein
LGSIILAGGIFEQTPESFPYLEFQEFWHYQFLPSAPPGGVIGAQNFELTIWEGSHRAQEISFSKIDK